jgi:hypothetical protein
MEYLKGRRSKKMSELMRRVEGEVRRTTKTQPNLY